MKCPKCPCAALKEITLRPGLQVDQCPGCGGLWLDKAEIYAFVKNPADAYREFVEIYKDASPTRFVCPRCGSVMRQAQVPEAQLLFEGCPSCGGTWFDAGEIQELNQVLDMKASLGKQGGAGPEPARHLSEADVSRLLGADFSSLLALPAGLLAAALLAAAAPALRPLPRLLGVAALCALAAWRSFSSKHRYFRGAVLVRGEIAGYGGQKGTRRVMTARFSLGGKSYAVSREIDAGGSLDRGVGSTVDVVVNPGKPAGAYPVHFS